jgi:hypothetical protein
MTQQHESSEDAVEVLPDISSSAAPRAQPNVDKTYHTLLHNQLDRAYHHVGQYLVAKGDLDARSVSESPDPTPVFTSVSTVEEPVRADLEALHILLAEITQRVKTATINLFATGALYGVSFLISLLVM